MSFQNDDTEAEKGSLDEEQLEQEAILIPEVPEVWLWEDQFGSSPPKPIFNSEDDQECRDVVKGYYGDSVTIFENSIKQQEKLDVSYSKILERQETYGIELVNNALFTQWVSTAFGTPDPNGLVPAFDEYMIASWGLWNDEA